MAVDLHYSTMNHDAINVRKVINSHRFFKRMQIRVVSFVMLTSEANNDTLNYAMTVILSCYGISTYVSTGSLHPTHFLRRARSRNPTLIGQNLVNRISIVINFVPFS